MGYYRRRRYRNWRSRNSKPTVYQVLSRLLGDAVWSIRKAFLELDDEALDELFEDYGALYGVSAEKYARKTFPAWKSGRTKLSGQTMERLVELVPPYLSPELRYELLQDVLKKHEQGKPHRVIRVNTKSPQEGLTEIDFVLETMKQDDALAFVPDVVMQAATWLYDDDITAARAMIAEAKRRENELIKATAKREIELLKRTISSGQLKSASYTVEMPAGTLSIVVYQPSRCFVATVCFGQNSTETQILREWRDQILLNHELGRNFVVWYYKNGEVISQIIGRSKLLTASAKLTLRLFIKLIENRRSF